jgi:hypothetical protein
MSQHTPGPWEVVDEESFEWNSPSSPRREIVWKSLYGSVYRIGYATYPTTAGGTMGAAERLSNARLIAAAPDLLAALETILDVWDDGQRDFEDRMYVSGTFKAVLDESRAAIKKARGE